MGGEMQGGSCTLLLVDVQEVRDKWIMSKEQEEEDWFKRLNDGGKMRIWRVATLEELHMWSALNREFWVYKRNLIHF